MTTILTNLVTDEELTAAFDHVMAAPLNDGPVRLLCARPKPNARTYPQSLTLTRAHGVIGDFQMSQPWLELPDGSPDPQIQVSVLPFRSLDLCWRNRDNPRATHPGDNIVTDMNLSYANVPTGSLLQAGTAVLRVSEEPNDGCVKWCVFRSIRPLIPTTSGHLCRSIRPPVTRCREAVGWGYQI